MIFNREKFYGLNFNWYAVDANNCIAKFISGYGSIPKDVFADKSIYETVNNYFENLIANKEYKHSPLQKSRMNRIFYWNEQDWNEAMKGLYLYDEKDYGPNYDLLSSPTQSIHFLQQPSEIKDFLSKFIIPMVTFENCNQIDPQNYFDCG